MNNEQRKAWNAGWDAKWNGKTEKDFPGFEKWFRMGEEDRKDQHAS